MTTLSIDVERLKKDLRAQMDLLPQRDLIQASDAEQWIGYMANLMPQEAMWHMIRAGGVGGSEIGGLVRNYLGHRADHEFSAHDWALSKLLRSTPDPATDVLQRGHEMEPIHAKRFYAEFNSNRDEKAYEKLKRASGSLVWMRYSPDDVITLAKPTTFLLPDGPQELSGRILLDYKAPTSVDRAASISFQYACQLHQGAILCEENDIEINGTMLSQFDWATWSLKNDFVSINPELCELIKATGTHYWDCVMRGEIPPYIHRKKYQAPPDLLNWEEAAFRYGQIAAMKTILDNESKVLKEKILEGTLLEKYRLGGQDVVFKGALKITSPISIDEDKVRQALPPKVIDLIEVKETATKYDEERMKERLQALGENMKDFKKLKKLDADLAFDALVAAGLDPEKFMTQNLRFNVDAEIKREAQDWFEQSFPALELPEPKKDPVIEVLDELTLSKMDEAPAVNAVISAEKN